MTTAAVLDQLCLELPGARVVDLRRRRWDHADDELRRQLEQGLAVDPDPRRTDFYEASINGRRFYFHVFLRRTPRVYLLASW